MRNAFGRWFAESGRPEVDVLLSGDIGYGVFDQLIKDRPRDFVNMGIAEQAMVGAACGLAEHGYTPWVYTIIPFLIFRPFDFVRNLICYDKANVKLVGVGGGLVYDNLGYTHYAVEDVSIASQLHNLRVLIPYSPSNVWTCASIAQEIVGPVYLRLGKGKEQDLPLARSSPGADFISEVADSRTLIVSYGGYIADLYSAELEFRARTGRSHDLLAVYDVTRLSADDVCLRRYKHVMLIEEQSAPGNWKLRDFLAKQTDKLTVRQLSTDGWSRYAEAPPSREALLALFGLDPVKIVAECNDE